MPQCRSGPGREPILCVDELQGEARTDLLLEFAHNDEVAMAKLVG